MLSESPSKPSNCLVLLSDYPIMLLDGPTMLTEGPNGLIGFQMTLSGFQSSQMGHISESQMISYHDHALRLSEGHMMLLNDLIS